MKNLRDRVELSKTKKHDIDLLVDSFSMHEFKDNLDDARMRLSEAVELALVESDGLVTISFGRAESEFLSPLIRGKMKGGS